MIDYTYNYNEFMNETQIWIKDTNKVWFTLTGKASQKYIDSVIKDMEGE